MFVLSLFASIQGIALSLWWWIFFVAVIFIPDLLCRVAENWFY